VVVGRDQWQHVLNKAMNLDFTKAGRRWDNCLLFERPSSYSKEVFFSELVLKME
jgi:hypothetical protein